VTATTDPDARKAFVDGLRALARFLVSHPDVPVPAYGTTILLSTLGTDDENRRDVDGFTAATAATVDDDWDRNGHYRAARMFGPVEYAAVAISEARMAAYRAETTCSGCVQPANPAGHDDDPADFSGLDAIDEAA
jgi:hypothetical protein